MIEIIPNLYLGGSSQMIRSLSCVVPDDLIINCTRDIVYETNAKVTRIEVEDDCSNKAMNIMKTAFSQVIQEMVSVIARGNKVFVHCKMGQQRSCAIIAAYLMQEMHLTQNQAVQMIKSKKKDAFFWQINFADALDWWFKYLQGTNNLNI